MSNRHRVRRRPESEIAIRAAKPAALKRIDTSAERFWKYANKLGADECWNWSGTKSGANYGVICVRRHPGVRLWQAHRLSWELANGEIPPGMFVLHDCDNTLCVNPGHLWLGTQLDNMRDRARKKRGNQRSGSRHYKFKLSDQDILDIRASAETGRRLADKYKTTIQYISNIRTRRVRADAGTPTSRFSETPQTGSDATRLRVAAEMTRACDEMMRLGEIDQCCAIVSARAAHWRAVAEAEST